MGKPSDTQPDETSAKLSTDKDKTADANGTEEKEQPPKLTLAAQLRANVALLERAVQAKDTRLIVGRLLRQTAAIRQQVRPQMLKSLIEGFLPTSCPTRSLMLEHLAQVDISCMLQRAWMTAMHERACRGCYGISSCKSMHYRIPLTP